MTAEIIKEWWPLLLIILGWVVAGAVGWTKINAKVTRNAEVAKDQTDGLGRRVGTLEIDCATKDGRMDRFEKELGEFRADARAAADKMSRVEQAVGDLSETIRDGNTTLGVAISELNKTVQAMDKSSSNRLIRLETVQQIEKKIGPIPTE